MKLRKTQAEEMDMHAQELKEDNIKLVRSFDELQKKAIQPEEEKQWLMTQGLPLVSTLTDLLKVFIYFSLSLTHFYF